MIYFYKKFCLFLLFFFLLLFICYLFSLFLQSINSKQRGLRKQGNELAERDALELQRVTAEMTVLQKHLDSSRKLCRQHTALIQVKALLEISGLFFIFLFMYRNIFLCLCTMESEPCVCVCEICYR